MADTLLLIFGLYLALGLIVTFEGFVIAWRHMHEPKGSVLLSSLAVAFILLTWPSISWRRWKARKNRAKLTAADMSREDMDTEMKSAVATLDRNLPKGIVFVIVGVNPEKGILAVGGNHSDHSVIPQLLRDALENLEEKGGLKTFDPSTGKDMP